MLQSFDFEPLEAAQLKLVEETKALLIELAEIRSSIDFESSHDITLLLKKSTELQNKLVILHYLLENKSPAILKSEVQALVEESKRELEAAEESIDEAEREAEQEVASEELLDENAATEDGLDMEDLAEQEKAMGLKSSEDINESKSHDEDKSIAKKLELQPIDDLKRAIGLNERFYFANELFQGEGTEYARAIEEFNHLSTMEDAERLIESKYAERYHWDKHEEAQEHFKTLLQRRYLSNS